MNWKFWKGTSHKSVDLGVLWVTVDFRNGKKLQIEIKGVYLGKIRGEPLIISARGHAENVVNHWNEDQAVECNGTYYPMHMVKRIKIGVQGPMLRRVA